MLKRLAIIAVTAALASLAMAAHPNKTSNNEKTPAADKNPPVVLAAPEHQNDGKANETKASNDAPHWYATLEKPDLFVLLVAFVTGCIICWQSWETRKAAEAANKGIELSKTKERAKLRLKIDPIKQMIGTIPEVKMTVTNAGESNAIIGTAIAGLHLTDSEVINGVGSGYYWLKVNDALLKSEEVSEETIWRPGHPLWRYTKEDIESDTPSVLHLHGRIDFKDAFEDWWRFDFHYIWRPYPVDIWMPHLQEHIAGEWEDQIGIGETRKVKPSKKRWWHIWRNPDPARKKRPNPN